MQRSCKKAETSQNHPKPALERESNVEEKVQAINLTARVYQQIRKGILCGTWKPGEALTELKLTQKLSVSRTPVREALRQLELEGLVEMRPNRGAVVVGIGPSDIEDIYEIRSLLEGRAAEKAAAHIDGEMAQQLMEIVDLTEFYIERRDYDRVTAMDDRFHQLIYSLTGSRMFQRILADLHAYAENIRERSIKEEGRAMVMLAEHRAIVEALTAGDSVRAGQLMIEHVNNSAANMEKNHLLEGSN